MWLEIKKKRKLHRRKHTHIHTLFTLCTTTKTTTIYTHTHTHTLSFTHRHTHFHSHYALTRENVVSAVVPARKDTTIHTHYITLWYQHVKTPCNNPNPHTHTFLSMHIVFNNLPPFHGVVLPHKRVPIRQRVQKALLIHKAAYEVMRTIGIILVHEIVAILIGLTTWVCFAATVVRWPQIGIELNASYPLLHELGSTFL